MSQNSERKLLIPVFLTVFIDLLGATIVLPILAPLFLDLQHGIMPLAVEAGTDVSGIIRERTILFGLLIASFPLAQFFGAPLLGTWADRVGRKKVLSISLLGTLIGYILFALGIHYKLVWLLFLARILDGFTGGNISIAFSAISDVSTPESKTRNFGLIGMAFGLGFIIGPYIGGKLADPTVVSWFNFETPFWFAALLCVVNLLLVLRYFFETLKAPGHKRMNFLEGMQNIVKAASRPHLRNMFTVVFLWAFGFSLFTQFLQVFLIQKFNYTQGDIGDYFGYVGLWIAFTQGLITRFLSRRMAPARAASIFLFTLGVALVLLLIPDRAYYLFFLSPFVAMSQGILGPNMQTLVSNSGQANEQGEILGINQSVQSLAQAIPPIIAGFVVSIDRNLPILMASGFTLAAWLFYLLFVHRKTHTHATP